MKSKYRGVFSAVIVLLLLLLIQILMYGGFFQDLNTESEMIDDFSMIRGSIQRYVKLELANSKPYGEDIPLYIDSLLSKYEGNPALTEQNRIERFYNLDRMKQQWEEIQILVEKYHQNPTKKSKQDVIRKSEEIWKTTNSMVLRNQYNEDRVVSFFRYFTLIIGLNIVVIIAILIVYKKFVHNNLAASAILDPLTGAFNRRYFSTYLENEIQSVKWKHKAFSLIMVDIDHFKKVNDTHGHERGDYALKALTETIQNSIRRSDVLSRIGGEEFIVLLPDTDLSTAVQLAERIRKNAANSAIDGIGKLTISLGITEYKDQDTSLSILKRADQALYLAKENGRNRYEIM
ncbi:GGDEF domain-containing protein [Sinanaerobacter chloroacetimidivorans]|jgi:diguanylate cyclase (GGDEF)-like protein|uniref:GGDEF domain-containing protein n=1 Tax=Sinanaerobacter chloroacetimidivorans TaxID=2818044 RepID=A0A8J7VZY9_9FIRM|nr:GGDEF domain-containing protein [Sinanaerobacter chloroacetimidivorans]MBR0597831.1 GGDEF domain-containing protein [Sinanaerobacter chloroacetimidivorans]